MVVGPIGGALSLIGAQIGASIAIPSIAEELTKAARERGIGLQPGTSAEFAQRTYRDPAFRQAQFDYQDAALRKAQSNFAGSAAELVPLSRLVREDVKSAGYEAAVKQFLRAGYSRQDAARAAQLVSETETSREAGLGATIGTGEVGANLLGRSELAKQLGKVGSRAISEESLVLGRAARGPIPAGLEPSFIQQRIFDLPGLKRLQFLQNPIATATGRATSRAGILEGSTAVLGERVARRQFGRQEESLTGSTLGLEKDSIGTKATAELEATLAGGIAGSVVAKPLGFITGGQAGFRQLSGATARARAGVSRLYEVAGYIIDPAELPGDVATSLGDRLRRQVSKTTGLPMNKIRVTTINPGSLNPITGQSSPATASVSFVSNNAQAQIDALAKQGVFSPSSVSVLGESPAPSTVTTTTPTSTDTGEPITPPPTTPPPANVPPPAETTTDVPATTLSDVFAPIPSQSTIYRGGIPFPPLFGPPSSGYRGGRGRARLRYINELDLFKGLVAGQFGRPARTLSPAQARKAIMQRNRGPQDTINEQRKAIRRLLRKKTTTKPLTIDEKRRFFELTGQRL